MSWELDRPLQFHGDSEVAPQPISKHNTATTGVDSVVYEATRKYEHQGFGSTRNMLRQKSDKNNYHDGVLASLHHANQYCPCRFMSADEYELQKARELNGAS